MITAQQRADNQRLLVSYLWRATKPEKTGKFSFDGFDWTEDGRLHLDGQHGTPDFEIFFLPKNTAQVYCCNGLNNKLTIHVPYSNISAVADALVRAMQELANE